MKLAEHELKDLDEFFKLFADAQPGQPFSASYVFRGQPSVSYLLEPSLFREIRGVTELQARQIEDDAFHSFRRQGSMHLDAAFLGRVNPSPPGRGGSSRPGDDAVSGLRTTCTAILKVSGNLTAGSRTFIRTATRGTAAAGALRGFSHRDQHLSGRGEVRCLEEDDSNPLWHGYCPYCLVEATHCFPPYRRADRGWPRDHERPWDNWGLRTMAWASRRVCEYPKHMPVPFVESDLWNGYRRRRTLPRPCQEDAPRPGTGLPGPVRVQRDPPAPDQSLWAARQLRSRQRPRHSGVDPQVHRGEGARRARSCSGDTARPPASSSTSRTLPRASFWRPIGTTAGSL